jgi:hypothetical protein
MRAHKSVCPYCNNLIEDFAGLEVDHIIPNSLQGTALAELLTRLGKPDLELESYFNWFPAHRKCNNRKGDDILPDASLHFYLGEAARREAAGRREESVFLRQQRANNTLAKLVRQIEIGALSKNAVVAYLNGVPITSSSKADPTILSFSINLAEARTTDRLFGPAGEVLMQFGENEEADWASFLPESLETELKASLEVLDALLFRTERENNGETLSLRYAIWPLNLDLLPEAFPNAWRLLEVAPFSEIYPGQDANSIVDRATILKSNDLLLDLESDEPLPYRYCRECGSNNFDRSMKTTPKENIYRIRCRECGWAEEF